MRDVISVRRVLSLSRNIFYIIFRNSLRMTLALFLNSQDKFAVPAAVKYAFLTSVFTVHISYLQIAAKCKECSRKVVMGKKSKFFDEILIFFSFVVTRTVISSYACM